MAVITEWKPSIVIVDQDDVVAAYKRKFCEIWNSLHPDMKIEYEEITSPYLEDHFKEKFPRKEYKIGMKGILTTPGFFLSLDPVPGAKEALEEMVEMGHTVNLCTQPLFYVGGEKVSYLDCESEKRRWIINYLGETWHDRMITTPDKTREIADILIDDNPKPKGKIARPLWRHVIFDQPYNRTCKTGNDIKGPRIRSWPTWKEAMPELVPPDYKK